MCSKPALAYNKSLDRFLADGHAKAIPEDVFMSMDELCTSKKPEHSKHTVAAYEQNRSDAMEKIIRELIGDRLLELSRYVTLDSVSKTMHVDESYLKKRWVSDNDTLNKAGQI